MRITISIVLLGLVLTAGVSYAQQITFTNNYKFPIIPRGYKQYWDTEYNASMTTLEVLFNKTVFVDKTNIFQQRQQFNGGLRISGEVSITDPIAAYGGGNFYGNTNFFGGFTSSGPATLSGPTNVLSPLTLQSGVSVTGPVTLYNGSEYITITNDSGLRVDYFNGAVTRTLLFGPDGSLKTDGFKFWNELNDGPGSGLDADTIDGKHLNEIISGGEEGDALTDVTAGTYVIFKEITLPGVTNAVRFDVRIVVALPDGSDASSGDWTFVASKTSDGTLLVSQVMQRSNFDGVALDELSKDIKELKFALEVFAGSLLRLKVYAETAGTDDPGTYNLSYKIERVSF